MVRRNLLAFTKLAAFKAWLDTEGIEWRDTTADYQVIQVRLPNDPRWHPVYQKLGAKVHYSLPSALVPTVMRFLGKPHVEVHEDKLKPVAEHAADTLPWL